jgi:hypothetical protein
MIREMVIATHQDMTTDRRLWRAVMAGAIQDWLSGPLRLKRQAERYLFENSQDLSLVCESAGMDIGTLRGRLNELRGQSMSNIVTVAA